MPGPAPKDASERARRNTPERGEWVVLPPLTEPILPELPDRSESEGAWSPRTVRAWAAWRSDWVTGAYSATESEMAVSLAYIFDEAVTAGGKSSLWAEVRQWMDRLGLTMKGKRDLRLRTTEEQADDAEAGESKSSEFGSLRLIDDALAS